MALQTPDDLYTGSNYINPKLIMIVYYMALQPEHYMALFWIYNLKL